MKPSFDTLLILFAVYLVLFLVERFFPLRRRWGPLWHHVVVNALLSMLAFAVAAYLVQPAAKAALRWSSDRSFGLLPLVDLPSAVRLASGFLLLDLSFYYWHVLNHSVP